MDQSMTAEDTDPEPNQTPADTRRAGFVGALWGALATAAILVPLYLVQSYSSERGEGGSITGNTGPAGNNAAAQPPMKGAADPRLQPLRDAIKADPKAAAPRLQLIRAQIGRRRFIQAYESANALLKIDPENAQGKTFLAIVRIEMGMASKATQLLSEALQKDPSLVEAWIYRGVANLRNGEAQAALDDWQEAIGIRPDAQTVLEPLIKRARGVLSGEIKVPERKPHPGMSAGMPAGHPGNQPAKKVGGPAAKVTISLAPGAQAKKGEVLFVIARAAGVAAGPPAAVKRLTVGDFPIEVSLTAADAMMGGALPAKLDITARVDGDGNPLTKNDGVRGSAAGVALGGEAASLTLAPQTP